MSQLQMVPPDHPALTRVAEPVHPMHYETLEGRAIIQHQLDQMHNIIRNGVALGLSKNQGVGLAAPQVGISQRFFIIDYGGIYSSYINPEIIKIVTKKGEERGPEGCLSFPNDGEVFISRWNRIKVHYIHPSGQVKSHYLQGFKARIFQHELDHLNGVTIQTHRDGDNCESII